MTECPIKLTLPFPPKELSPNARLHWARKEKHRKNQKEIGYYEALPHRGKIGMEYVPLILTFYPKSRACFDADGLLSRMKAALDGVAKGLGINDKQFRPITIDITGGRMITLPQRHAASEILRVAGCYHESRRLAFAHEIGVDENLVWYALKNARFLGQYKAPEWVIERVLEWGNAVNNGGRGQKPCATSPRYPANPVRGL